MKIVFYINSICHGGAERVICNLANNLSKHGHACTMVTSFLGENEYLLGSQVNRISLFEKKLQCGFIKRNAALVAALRRVIKKEKPDAVISFMAEPNFRAIIAGMGCKHKTIISVRNDPDHEYPNAMNKLLAKTLFALADGIVFQTEDAKNWFPKAIQRKAAVIFNQVDELFYRITWEGERHDVVTTGRLAEQKNQQMLIRAFADVADQVQDNLIIYGEGPLRQELECLVRELGMEGRIFLPGATANVAESIRAAKLFVLSSDYEGMPNALMEAMALGVPCIATDCPCGGPRVLLSGFEEGRLVPCGDVAELSAAIEKKLTDGSDGKIEKQLAEKFRTDVIYNSWERYIADVAAEL